MFGFFKKSFTPTYTVEKLPNGRFGIVTNNGEVLTTYSRKRDAYRGAERNGIELA